MTFEEATTEAIAWIAGNTGPDQQPQILTPGKEVGASGIGITPWRLDSPRTDRTGEGTILSATARFCVWVWSADLLESCAHIDAIFFAAMNDPDWTLSDTEPPAAFWPGEPPLFVVLARKIERTPAQPEFGRVEEPLVFDISTRMNNNSGERT